MEFVANEGKKVEIEVNGETYLRHAIKTRFVQQGDDYIKLFEEYVTKKDFLMVKNINGSSNQMIHYKFDIVTDEDLKMPDLTGYTVKEAD